MNLKLLSVTATLALLATAQGQPFEVQTTFIGTATGVSRNGPFALSGAIGQPESGTMTDGGAFTVEGGWPAPLIVESPGAPSLWITFDPAFGVTVAWPATASDHRLEVNEDLSNPTGWQNVSTTPSEVGANLEVSIQPTARSQFYRLRRAN